MVATNSTHTESRVQRSVTWPLTPGEQSASMRSPVRVRDAIHQKFCGCITREVSEIANLDIRARYTRRPLHFCQVSSDVRARDSYPRGRELNSRTWLQDGVKTDESPALKSVDIAPQVLLCPFFCRVPFYGTGHFRGTGRGLKPITRLQFAFVTQW